MKFDLSAKTILVTGGGSGIGAAIAQALALQNATLGVLDVHPEAAEKTCQKIHAAGGKALPLACDVSNFSEVTACVAQFERIDALINNAGIAHVGSLENTSPEDLDRLYAVNIKGVFHAAKAVLPKMKQQKSGNIVNIASIAGSLGIADRFAYSMTKGAVLSMTYSIAKDFINDGIRCNSISPARIHTPFVDGFIKKNYPGKEDEMFEKLSKSQPIGRMGKVDEISGLILYLCSDEAAFITGSNFPIDGGFVTLNN